MLLIINPKFSKFFPNIPKILFKIYFKFPISFIQNLSKIPSNFLKSYATFIPESFPEISTNFSENFLKNLVEISIKLYLRIAQILIVYPKFPENFLLFSKISIKFHENFITSTFSQSVNQNYTGRSAPQKSSMYSRCVSELFLFANPQQ